MMPFVINSLLRVGSIYPIRQGYWPTARPKLAQLLRNAKYAFSLLTNLDLCLDVVANFSITPLLERSSMGWIYAVAMFTVKYFYIGEVRGERWETTSASLQKMAFDAINLPYPR